MRAIESFQVLSAERAAGGGKLVAKGVIAIFGVVAEMRVLVFDGAKGRFCSVDGGRDNSGGYARPVRFERGVSDSIAAAILSYLEKDGFAEAPLLDPFPSENFGRFDRI